MASVLVVDDEADYPQLLSIILSKEGFEVQTAASGHEATQQCAHSMPDVLVVDWMLEGSNGLDVAAALRTRNPKLRTILITVSFSRPGGSRRATAGNPVSCQAFRARRSGGHGPRGGRCGVSRNAPLDIGANLGMLSGFAVPVCF